MKRSMTRRDYRIIAYSVHDYLARPPPHTVDGVVTHLAAALAAAYPNFDEERFLAAVYDVTPPGADRRDS